MKAGVGRVYPVWQTSAGIMFFFVAGLSADAPGMRLQRKYFYGLECIRKYLYFKKVCNVVKYRQHPGYGPKAWKLRET